MPRAIEQAFGLAALIGIAYFGAMLSLVITAKTFSEDHMRRAASVEWVRCNGN